MIKRRHAVIAALIGCLGIGIAWGVHRPGEAVGDAALAITVLTMNVGDAGRRVFPVAETAACILDGGRPDILLLQEMPGGLAGAALRKALGYPYECRAESAAGKLGALMVLSAHPVLESRQIALPSARKGVGALCVVLGIAGESVLACSVHLDEVAPKTRNVEGQVVLGARELFELLWIELFTETVRTQGAKALTEAIGRDAARMPVILAGDFNTVPGSRTIRYLTGRYKDACWPSTAWFYGTYHKVAFPLSPRIDYIFVSNHWSVDNARVLRRSAGDHYPVTVRIKIGATGPQHPERSYKSRHSMRFQTAPNPRAQETKLYSHTQSFLLFWMHSTWDGFCDAFMNPGDSFQGISKD